jgi:hypothetical protein
MRSAFTAITGEPTEPARYPRIKFTRYELNSLTR